jgi:hypothetical protein
LPRGQFICLVRLIGQPDISIKLKMNY